MMWAWTGLMVLGLIIACHQRTDGTEDSCADYPNGVCPNSDANQQQTSEKAETDQQVGSAANQAGSAMQKQIASSIDFSVLDETDSTLLHWAAARKRNTETLKFLLKQGVIDINKQNKFGNTALHVAVFRGDYGGVDLLLKQKNINKSLRNGDNLTAQDIAKKLKLSLIAALFKP